MRVLFIVRDLAVTEPVGLMQLGSALRRAGHEVRLADATRTSLLPLLASSRPGLIGYTLITGEHRALLRLNVMVEGARGRLLRRLRLDGDAGVLGR